MKFLQYEIRKVLPKEDEIKKKFLEHAYDNATKGLIQAQLELTHHTLLLKQAPKLKRTKEEKQGYKDAIERDKKSINNWQTQLTAIQAEMLLLDNK